MAATVWEVCYGAVLRTPVHSGAWGVITVPMLIPYPYPCVSNSYTAISNTRYHTTVTEAKLSGTSGQQLYKNISRRPSPIEIEESIT